VTVLATPTPTPTPTGTRTPTRRLTRARLRRLLFWLGVPPLLVALALVLKVGTMVALNSSGRDAFDHGRLGPAVAAFRSTLAANVLEPWVAPYDVGTTLYRQHDYEGARHRLEDALALVPSAEECRVRVNLALTDEALGDAALGDGDVTGARDRWTAARDDLAGGRCTDEAVGTRDRRLTAAAMDTRLRGKLDSTEEPEAADTRGPEDQAAASLDERNERAEQRRRRAEQRREDKPERPTPGEPGQEPPHYEW
jgi:hypothetical protein